MRPTRWPNSGWCRRRRGERDLEARSRAKFDIERIDAIEREVKHDVIAFLTHLAEIVGPRRAFCTRA